ncbi:glycosyltransferase family 2 protein [Flavobacterium sp. TMP13]|uniref:glycosyltransferase family 2 protein n=1 Tax=Flavobacterium sp. TMP13 TaxID=3425950 RepID=UPI003D76D8E4
MNRFISSRRVFVLILIFYKTNNYGFCIIFIHLPKDKKYLEEIYTINDIEFLISTQNRNSLDFLESIFPNGYLLNNLLIVNQTTKDNILISNDEGVRVVNSFEIGVAKSRNIALENAKKKLLVFTDDDVNYLTTTKETILKAYNLFHNADAILFQIQKNDTVLFKKYPKNIQNPISIFTILNCGTIEITLKNPNLSIQKAKFNEWFGLNSFFDLGDEPLFLMEMKRDEKKLIFYNETIVTHSDKSTADKIILSKKYYNLGAFYKRIFPDLYFVWLVLKITFDLKQKKIKLKNLVTVVRNAKHGIRKLNSLEKEKNNLL